MSYLVLARKYRSSTFDEVVGQEAISQTLVNAIKTGRIHHAYLFTGTRGVGKTTMARILAKALNCLKAAGPTAAPCNECDACVAIARGDDIDVVEIDGASNRGIEEIRQLRANVILRPARSRFKVYYIDEVHMLTKEAFNALLKTLEEPPGHVKFIFATTEVDKLPATIISRCQRFDFRNIPTRRIAEHLKALCRAEKVQADDDALFRIARAGAGSMRDALSLLDQLLAAGPQVADEDVIRILGTPPDERMLAIAKAIAEGSAGAALTEFSAVMESGVSLASAAAALGDVFRNLMIASVSGAQSDLIELPDAQRQTVGELAGRFSTPTLVQAVGILQGVARSIRGSSVARALVEAAIVRLAEADKFVDPASLIERLEAFSHPHGQAATPPAAGEKKNGKKAIALPSPATGGPEPPGTAGGPAEHAGPAPARLAAQAAGPAAPSGGGRQRGARPSGVGSSPSPAGAAQQAQRWSNALHGTRGPQPASGAGEGQAESSAAGAAGQTAALPAASAAAATPTLNTAQRNHLAKDPAVRTAVGLFGGDIVDIRVDAGAPDASAVEEDEQTDDGA